MKFILPIEPVGQMRPRFTVKGRHAQAYKDPKQRAEEKALLTLAAKHKPAAPLQGPLEVTIDAYMPIPKSFSRMKRQMAMSGELRPAKKPDASNIAKHIEDCFNKVFWGDDAQIVGLLVRKYYSDFPRWEVEIKSADEL